MKYRPLMPMNGEYKPHQNSEMIEMAEKVAASKVGKMTADQFFDRTAWSIHEMPTRTVPRRDHVCVVCQGVIKKGAKDATRAGHHMRPIYCCGSCRRGHFALKE